MSSADEYRRHAEECARMAGGNINTQEKAAWLEMGETWLRMANQVETVLPPAPLQSSKSSSAFSDPDQVN